MLAAVTNWLGPALRDPSFRFWAGLFAVLVVGLALVGRMLRRLAPHRPARSRRPRWAWLGWSDETHGVAMLEFALVFPILLFLILLLAQVTFLMTGSLFVHYAGYAAARTAATVIPLDLTTEPTNVINPQSGSAKFDLIQRAAALAVLPAAGRATSGTVSTEALVSAVSRYFTDQNQAVPAWVTNGVLADKYRYAMTHTSVTLYTPQVQNDGSVQQVPVTGGMTLAPRDAVTVRVMHELYLGVPYVRAFFASTHWPTLTSDDLAGRMTQVMTQMTLNLEGDPIELPPEPTQPRVP